MPSAIQYGVLDVLDVLDNVLHLGGRVSGDEYVMTCPRPEHVDRRPSCGVNLTTGYWSCLSCGVGGDFAELAMKINGSTLFEARQLLSPTDDQSVLQVVKRRLEFIGERARPTRQRSSKVRGVYAAGPMDYMYNRGFSDETCYRWGLRYVEREDLTGTKGRFTIRHSIAIPIRDDRGHLQAWCYRATERSPRWQPKYLYTPGVEISELWFGVQHHARADSLTVVEGALDAMWCDQAGITAWGMLGSKMGVRKILRITDAKRVVLLADMDDAGAEWVQRVVAMIGTRMPVFIGQYRSWMTSKRPDADGNFRPATDPEELRPLDLEIVHATAVPYLKWKYL